MTNQMIAFVSFAVVFVLYGVVRKVTVEVFSKSAYRPVVPVAGIHRFDKPRWAELVSLVMALVMVGLFVWGSVELWRSGSSWATRAVDLVFTVALALKYLVEAVREVADRNDFLELSDSLLRLRDGKVVREFERSRMAGGFVEPGDEVAGHRLVFDYDGRREAIGLGLMNLDGIAEQIRSLLGWELRARTKADGVDRASA